MPAAWTPVDRASSPLLYDTPTHSLRVYFYDLTIRAEITIPPYHELSGMIWTGTGPMVSLGGHYVDGTASAIHGVAYFDRRLRCVTVDASSFPGRKVVAKIWYARVGDLPDRWAVPEWRVLARGDGSLVLGRGLPIENRAWTASYLAGLVS